VNVAEVRAVVAAVVDPEIPVLTIDDLGVLRDVRVDAAGRVEVDITPTYSGCPATEVIRRDVESALRHHGIEDASVRTVLSPAWTTDWMSDEGRRKLDAYGVAPPDRGAGPPPLCQRAEPAGTTPHALDFVSALPPLSGDAVGLGVRCPQCGSMHTDELSRFGSTPCKALRRCGDCREPFEHFKPH
jgi:ring-1,2-phenylacetyl-CoA epoxidase subunit PaaD